MSTQNFSKTHAVRGFGQPLTYALKESDPFYVNKPLPNALNLSDLDDGRVRLPLTPIRELTMLRLMDIMTDKSDWHKKIFEDEIAQKWKAEALTTPGRDVTEKMVEWCLNELKEKATYFLESPVGAIKVYNGDVVKSDSAVSNEIKEALQKAVKSLEDVPDRLKDWHPGSDGKVRDLVHPSLFPLVYGKSKILPIGSNVTTLEDCVKRCGEGEVIPLPKRKHYNPNIDPWSNKFQWLPCEVDISGEKAKILTYINNLHPRKHGDLYHIIEDVITSAIKLWDVTLAPLADEEFSHSLRIIYNDCVYDNDPEDGPETDGPQREQDEDEYDYYVRRQEWYEATRTAALPETDEFEPLAVPEAFNLKETYGERGRPLQIIVKLANIELTPEKPEYEGGTWHVEGKLNEQICATALYYYALENISPSCLAFRQQSDDDTINISYQQDHHDWLPAVFGCEQNGPAVQIVGSVDTREGRLLTFPNILQHQVQPFRLVDPTKPGHRKILALFLVDPNVRVISTANIPCQKREWWKEETLNSALNSARLAGKGGLNELPVELQDHVFNDVEGFPISLKEAKDLRWELMDERMKFVDEHICSFEEYEFSLCEH